MWATSGRTAARLDNLLWLFRGDGYGEVCSRILRCDRCEFRTTCRYPKEQAATLGDKQSAS
jgi:hypothetical protein